MNTVSRLQLGTVAVFEATDRSVKKVSGNSVVREKRSEMRCVSGSLLEMHSVRVLAFEDVHGMHIGDFLRWFPRLEKLYLLVQLFLLNKMSLFCAPEGSRSAGAGTYGVRQNPIGCLASPQNHSVQVTKATEQMPSLLGSSSSMRACSHR